MSAALTYAIFAALSLGCWALMSNAAAQSIDSAFGATLVSGAAVVFGLLVITFSERGTAIHFNIVGLLCIACAGIFAFLIDYFILRSFSLGMPAAVGGPIVIGGGILAASLLGSILRGEVSLIQLLAATMIVFGSALLAREM